MAKSRKPRSKPARRKKAAKSPPPDIYQALLLGASEGILVADLETRKFRYANPAMCTMLGYSEDELLGMGVDDIHPRDALPHALSEFEAQARGERALAAEIPCLRKDGTTFHADISTAKVVLDGKDCNLGFFTDVTERKRATEALKEARDELESRVKERTVELSRAYEELRESEELYRQLVELDPDGVVIIQDGRLKLVNSTFTKLFGYARDDIRGDFEWMRLVREEDKEFVRGRVEARLAGEKVSKMYVLDLVARDGTIVPCETAATLIQYHGRPADLVAMRDLRERQRARRALVESEQKWRHLVENIPDLIFNVTREGIIKGMNRTVIDVAPEEVEGRNIYDYIVPEHRDAMREIMRRAYDAGEPGAYEIRGTGADGPGTAWYSTRVVPVERDGKIVSVMQISTDITERRRAEDALKASELSYRMTLDSMGDSIHVVDRDLNVVLCNEALQLWYKELGLGTDILGKNVFDICPFLSETVRQEYEEVFTEGLPLRTEEITEISGKELITETRKIPILKGGEVDRVVTVIRDITGQKRTLIELEERHQELERLHRAKDEFIAMVSHELRTPLVTGLGYIELMLEGMLGPVSERAAKGMKVAFRNLTRLSALIDDVLSYHHLIESDPRARPVRRPVDLAMLLRDAVAEFLVREGIEAERVSQDIPPGLPPVIADVDMIRRVLDNLLDNAARHAGRNAGIAVAVAECEGGVEVSVSDDGPGMPPELAEKAFELFVKSAASTQGSGLGLAIIREILQAHGSKPALRTAPGEGTSISFVLEASASASAREHAHRPASVPAEAPTGNILIVDDDLETLDFLALVLRNAGYSAAKAASAEEAIDLLDANHFDLAVVDMSLPGTDGADLCRRIKLGSATSDVPVCIFTARAEDSARQKAEACGCDAYIVKPIAVNEFVSMVRRLKNGKD